MRLAMNASLPQSLASALLSPAPAGSIVHKIVSDFDWLRKLSYLDAKERREMRDAVGRQQDYLRATGGLL